tara:strand:- start:409 stop:1695 length:1287 start_codon:yes stop_codon:yes gene_type:complete
MVVITQQVPLRAAMGAPRPAVCMLDDGKRSLAGVQQAFASAAAALLLSGSLVASPLPSLAADSAAIGSCLLKSCQLPLAKCVTNPTCAANLLCIQTCTSRAPPPPPLAPSNQPSPAPHASPHARAGPDESVCQIECGDKFSNQVVADFTDCAVTEKKCVPQRQDDGSYPVPADDKLVQSFSTELLQGDWYISAGFNKAFDTFDCQLHKFEAPSPTKLVGNMQWRIKDPLAGTNFVTRYTVQTFDMDEKRQGILYNHDNEFLHYQDDWYILAAKDQKYVVVYYRGNNDAWDGYGGAVVYTKAAAFPKEYTQEVSDAVAKVGLKFSDFELTDNSCKASEGRLKEFEEDLVFVEGRLATGIQLAGEEVSKDVVAIEKEVVKDVVAIEKEVVKDVVAIEKEVVKDAVAIEKEIVKDVENEVNAVEKAFGLKK